MQEEEKGQKEEKEEGNSPKREEYKEEKEEKIEKRTHPLSNRLYRKSITRKQREMTERGKKK